MNSEKQRRIEQRAYALWEAEGQPHGRHEEHWNRAAYEIEAEETAQIAANGALRRVSESKKGNSGRRSTATPKRARV